MYTVVTIALILIIYRRKFRYIPVTGIFVFSYIVKVGLPFYYYTKYSEMELFSDLLSVASFVTIFLVSSVGRYNKCSLSDQVRVTNKFYYGSIALLLVSWFLFFVPVIKEGVNVPILEAIFGDSGLAHNLRVYISKESSLGFMIDLVGKVLFSGIVFVLGIAFKNQAWEGKAFSIFMVLCTMVVSVSYFQKAFPFGVLLFFLFGMLFGRGMTASKALTALAFSAVCLYLLSSLFVADPADTILKFQDLFFRRLGRTPVLVYEAYLDYGNLNGLALLEYNFVLNKTPTSPALPMLIYDHMSYGDSATGWANGLFIGDAYVNFGVSGVIAVSVFIGLLLRIGNNMSREVNKVNVFFVSALLGIISLCFVVPGNAFFAFSVQFFVMLFLVSFFLYKYPRIRP